MVSEQSVLEPPVAIGKHTDLAVLTKGPKPSSNLFLGYRTILQIDGLADGAGVGLLAEDYLRDWLRSLQVDQNKLDNWDGKANLELSQVISVTGFQSDDDQSGQTRRRFTVRTSNHGRIFITRVYAIGSGSKKKTRAYIVVEGMTEAANQEKAALDFGVPRIVKNILSEERVYEGRTRLQAQPRYIDADNVSEVYEAIVDQQRTVAVIVSCVPSLEEEQRWTQMTQSLVQHSVGTAATFIVRYGALDELNNRLPEHLRVRSKSVRTFLANVDLELPLDGIRHLFLGQATLARQSEVGQDGSVKVGGFLPQKHALVPRMQLIEKELPAAIRRQIQLLNRDASRQERVREAKKQARAITLEAAPLVPDVAVVEHGKDVAVTVTKPAPMTVSVEAPETTVLETPTPPSPKISIYEQIKRRFVEREAEAAAVRKLSDEATGSVLEAPKRPLTRIQRRELELDKRTEELLTPPWWGRMTKMVKRWLDLESEVFSDAQLDQYLAELDRLIDEKTQLWEMAEEENAVTDEELNQLRGLLEQMRKREESRGVDFHELQEELDEALRHKDFYQRQLIRHQKTEFLTPPTVDEKWIYPTDMDELVAMLDPTCEPFSDAADYVRFTGEGKYLSEFTTRDSWSTMVRAAWNFVHTLHDYAQLKATQGFNGGVHDYLLSSETQGYKVSHKRHSPKESESVAARSKWREARMLPVPKKVDPSGYVYMEAHFRIETNDGFAPRMHYYDDTARSGKIYIGYIGRHLPNTRGG